MHSTTTRILRNTGFLTLSVVIGQVANILVSIYVARTLGDVNFGILAFAQALISYCWIFSNLGLRDIGIRNIAADRSLTQEYAGTIIAIRLIASLIIFSVLIATVSIGIESKLKIWTIILYGLTLFTTSIDLSWVFEGHQKMGYTALLNVMWKLLYFVGVFFFITKYHSILVLPAVDAVVLFLTGGLSIFFVAKLYGRLKLSLNFNYWKSLIITAFPLGISLIPIRLQSNFDTIILSFFKNDAMVGWYNAGYKIVWVLTTVGFQYLTALYPALASEWKITGCEGVKSILRKSLRLLISIYFPIGVGGMILSTEIIYMVFGKQYVNAGMVFKILVWVCVLMCINRVYLNTLISCERQLIFSKILFCTAGINLLLNFLLIPKFSLYGAAFATVISETTVFFLSYRALRKIVFVPFWEFIPKPFIAVVCMGIVLYLLKGSVMINISQSSHTFFLILTGTVVYFGILFFVGGVNKDDIKQLRKVFKLG